ncbi:MAG TPA: DUF882 domain-containing protein [Caulobacteraceae bacterium]
MKFGLGAAASAGVAAAPAMGCAQILIGRGASSQAAMRSVGLDNLHTGESMEAVYWEQGQYIPDVLAAVDTHLRDYRNGAVHTIDPRLLDLLDAVSDRTGSRSRFQVISGYRSPQTNALLHERSAEVAKKSFHIQGMAIDVRLPGVELHHLHAAAVSLGRGGVGFYPESNFVHIDVGPVRTWSGV